jgi:hypothetical protein
MRKPVFSILFVAALLAVAVIAEAQQPTKVPWIGYLTTASLSAFTTRTQAFRQGLRELGYIEGKIFSLSILSAFPKRSQDKSKQCETS